MRVGFVHRQAPELKFDAGRSAHGMPATDARTGGLRRMQSGAS